MKKRNIFLAMFFVLVTIGHTGNGISLALHQCPSSAMQDEPKKLISAENANNDEKYFSSILISLTLNDLFESTNECSEQTNASVVYEYDADRKIYVVNVLQQSTNNTCGRHTIKNLIYFINAIEQNNLKELKHELCWLYNKDASQALNNELCRYLHIADIYQDVTFPHKFFNLFSNIETFIHEHEAVRPFLDMNVTNILEKICPIPMSLDIENDPIIRSFSDQLFGDYSDQLLCFIEADTSKQGDAKEFYKKYLALDNGPTKNITSDCHILPSDTFKKVVNDFKNSEQKVLGLALLIPTKNSFGHWIGIVVRKTENSSFEFFVLDSAHNAINYGLKNTLDSLLQEFEPSHSE